MTKPRLQQSGFTLIEVMVALMIFSIVAFSASQASRGYLRTIDGMRTRTLAHFVAQNTAAELEMNEQWLNAASSQQKTQQGRTWMVKLTPSVTQNPNIQTIEINVTEVVSNSNGGNQKSSSGTGSNISITLSKPDEGQ